MAAIPCAHCDSPTPSKPGAIMRVLSALNAPPAVAISPSSRRSRGTAKLVEAVRLFVWHSNRRRRVINANPVYRDSLPLLF